MQHEPSGSRHEATPDAGAPPLGRLYEVGERRLMLHRSGTGSPAVVFVPGAGSVGLDFLNIHNPASGLTTSVLYDRAGTGWSDRVELPRTAAEVTDELRDLLRAAGMPAPYLLVGYSLGGLYARHYAQRFPDEAAGLVLLEPAHEDYNAHMPKQLVEMWGEWDPDQELPEPDEEQLQNWRGLFAGWLAEWPDPIRELLVEYHLRSWRTGFLEGKNIDELYDEVRSAGDTPDVPLIVLAAMRVDPLNVQPTPEHLRREEKDGKRRLYTALAGSVPRGEIRLLEDAGHSTIHTQRPDAVLRAIRDLMGGVDS